MRPKIGLRASLGDGFGEFSQEFFGLLPIDARIGNRNTIVQTTDVVDVLIARVDMAFNHQSNNGVVARGELPTYRVNDVALLTMVLI